MRRNPNITVEWSLRCGELKAGTWVGDYELTTYGKLSERDQVVARTWSASQAELQRVCGRQRFASIRACASWHAPLHWRATTRRDEVVAEYSRLDPMAATIAELQALEAQLKQRHDQVVEEPLQQLRAQISDARRFLLIQVAEDEKALAAAGIDGLKRLTELAEQRRKLYLSADEELRAQFPAIA
jgi:hypothetical protein